MTLAICCLLLVGSLTGLQAQGERQFLILSGVVVAGEESDPLPRVNVYIPKAGRGTSTNYDGFFVMPVMPGDSIIMSYVGYKKQYYIVPLDKRESYSVVFELREDVTNLPVIEILPYPTEELFKEAFLALELPDEEQVRQVRENLNRQLLTYWAYTMPMDGRLNYRYYTQMQVQQLEQRNSLQGISLMNPFAWAEFFKSVKRGELKKERFQQYNKAK
ncbi:carboxypeptidase-like regulatory domain-containing protein [Eisenibacter elegans]|uniref:carboxypeptidase-like regulatory domain-containing protein n=1 Tax=Eisenibacter elegans TaxID=997 RepID=UPI00137700DD|nr:carboxypeptidase-like regulatory domain-containing protein [Eisenibacter elegans]